VEAPRTLYACSAFISIDDELHEDEQLELLLLEENQLEQLLDDEELE